MALQTINVGNFANDGTGDDLRTAFTKINANFDELDLLGGQNNTISNIGTGAGLYKEKIGVDLRLKSLVAGPGISVIANATDLTINNTKNVIVKLNANTGSLTASSTSQEVNIVGGTHITTSFTGNTLSIDNTFTVDKDLTPKLGGVLNLNGYNITGGTGTTITAQNFVGNLTGNVTGNLTGNVTGLVNGVDVYTITNAFNTFDFGLITNSVSSPVEWMIKTTLFDFGNIDSLNPLEIDGGTFI